MQFHETFQIENNRIGKGAPCYFIADIAANHDGNLQRAQDLIALAKQAGAHCAKFQHFLSEKIVSAYGFAQLKQQLSHQAAWDKPVAEIYDEYHTRRDWTEQLVRTCQQHEITFMTTPYDAEAVALFAPLLAAVKIGSGDITYTAILRQIAQLDKPIFLATGAATMNEVKAAVATIQSHNARLCLMQCNTNYTGKRDNFNFVNLEVINSYAKQWPGIITGLSDHTPGHVAVLGAISKGAKVIEKHFTDDQSRRGPDHKFALNPVEWKQMMADAKDLEAALGDGIKRVEANENETVVVQRRALRMTRAITAGTKLTPNDLAALRPCPQQAITPNAIDQVLGKKLINSKQAGEELRWHDIATSQ